MWTISIAVSNQTPLVVGLYLSGGAGLETGLDPGATQAYSLVVDPQGQPLVGVHQSTGERIDFSVEDHGSYVLGFVQGKIALGLAEPESAVQTPGPITAEIAPPQAQACFQCGGSGKAHRSSMPHNEHGCIFCTTCPGCNGSGAIPGQASLCPKCQGSGKCHDSSMPHSPQGCIFCSDCPTCQTKGWI